MSKDEKTTWLRMESNDAANSSIADAIYLFKAVRGTTEPFTNANALAEICREWSEKERERIRRPEK